MNKYKIFHENLVDQFGSVSQLLEQLDDRITHSCDNQKYDISRFENALKIFENVSNYQSSNTTQSEKLAEEKIKIISRNSGSSLNKEFSSQERKFFRYFQKQLKYMKKLLKKKTKHIKRLRKKVQSLEFENKYMQNRLHICDGFSSGGAAIIEKAQNKDSTNVKAYKSRRVLGSFCFKTHYEYRTNCSNEEYYITASNIIDQCFQTEQECEKSRNDVNLNICKRDFNSNTFYVPVQIESCRRNSFSNPKNILGSLFRFSDISKSR